MRSDNSSFVAINTRASKDPRYTIELSFDTANTDLYYFTSHTDAQIPSGGLSSSNVISTGGITGTTQKIRPDKGVATIGNISIRLTDIGEAISTLFNTKLDIGSGLNGKRVRVYTSFLDEVWNNYVLIATQIIESIDFRNGEYILKCTDIQRSERKNIFDPSITTLSAAIGATDLLIPVYSVTGFDRVEHGTSYSDAPSDFTSSPQVINTVNYIKIEKEIIRCTGTVIDLTLGLSFVVDNDGASPATATGRGVLNTQAVAHETDNTLTDNSRKQKVTEYIYLEMPLVKLAYALLTGNLEGQTGKVLPSSWHLNIDTSFIKLADFTGVGSDWWDTTDDTAGIIGVFEGIKKQDAKKFIETEINLLLGSYNPIYASGELGLKRMTNILSGAGYVKILNEKNITNYGALTYDMRSILNSFQIKWNWNDTSREYTRTTLLIDSTSISINGTSKLKELSFRGLSGNIHSEATIFNLFNSLRDRYSGPPIRLKADCLPSLNVLEVGDVVRVKVDNIRDFTGALAPLDRQFEIQGITTNWITGRISLDLFASSQKAGALALGAAASVLNDSFYGTVGTELKTFIDGLGSPSAFSVIGGVGHITGNITLPGTRPASTIYYYKGPLTIDSGVKVTITNTVDLRIQGFLTIDGNIDGVGGGAAGIANVATEWPPTTVGTSAYLGTTEAGGGIDAVQFYGIVSIQALITNGQANSAEYFTLINDTTNDTIKGLPPDLSGSSGGPGVNVTLASGTTFNPNTAGGDGGAGGAGLLTISRGCDFGVSGYVDLSGDNGLDGNYISGVLEAGGGGAGGAPGVWLSLLDGETSTTPTIGTATLKSSQGITPVIGLSLPQVEYRSLRDYIRFLNSGIAPVSSYFPGSGVVGEYRGASSQTTQFIERDITAVPDVPINTVVSPTALLLSSGDSDLLKALDGTIISRIKISWTASTDQNLGGYEAEFKLSAETNWNPISSTVNLEINQIYLSPAEDGTNYDIRVRAINNIGIRSNWLTQSNYTVIGKLATPADCDSFTVQRLSDGTRVFDGGYVPASNAPVDFAGYEIRAAVGSGLTWSALTALHTGLITQLPFETNQLAAGNYTAGIKAVDTTGIYSLNAVLVDSTLGDPRIKFALATVDYKADGFPDIKTNCWVDSISGNLIATDQYTWANFATGSPIQTWADWTAWATNPNSPIIYETVAIDIGASLDITPLVTVISNGTTVLLQESHSDDDITYTSYAVSGLLINARYIKIKITITNATQAPLITAAQLIIDSEIVEEYIQDLDTSTVDLGSPRVAGDIRIPLIKTYSTIKSVQIALQNVGAGWSWEIIDKTVTGPRIKIYNASNVLADATIDAFISGA